MRPLLMPLMGRLVRRLMRAPPGTLDDCLTIMQCSVRTENLMCAVRTN